MKSEHIPQSTTNVNLLNLETISINDLDRLLYLKVWHNRIHKCECCNELLLEPLLFMFHHVLEKRDKDFEFNNYSKFRHCEWNIMLLCWICHTAYEDNPNNRPSIKQHRESLIQMVEGDYHYDSEAIWNPEETDYRLIYQLFGKSKINNHGSTL